MRRPGGGACFDRLDRAAFRYWRPLKYRDCNHRERIWPKMHRHCSYAPAGRFRYSMVRVMDGSQSRGYSETQPTPASTTMMKFMHHTWLMMRHSAELLFDH